MNTPEEELDHMPFQFGKYAGQTPDQVAGHDPGYIVWFVDMVDAGRVSKALYDACCYDLGEDDPFFKEDD